MSNFQPEGFAYIFEIMLPFKKVHYDPVLHNPTLQNVAL
jgi:hypothetical protein